MNQMINQKIDKLFLTYVNRLGILGASGTGKSHLLKEILEIKSRTLPLFGISFSKEEDIIPSWIKQKFICNIKDYGTYQLFDLGEQRKYYCVPYLFENEKLANSILEFLLEDMSAYKKAVFFVDEITNLLSYPATHSTLKKILTQENLEIFVTTQILNEEQASLLKQIHWWLIGRISPNQFDEIDKLFTLFHHGFRQGTATRIFDWVVGE